MLYSIFNSIYHELESYMSSYTTRANGIIVYYIDKHSIFGVVLSTNSPDFLFIHFSKTFNNFVFFRGTNQIAQ